ncbi:MAG: Rieske 2Fe-2S domain-containing protein [Acidobacteriia bacterium]|nr:Rieske 2Fe-2S domain-containing protein [Terriglobia bacterium]
MPETPDQLMPDAVMLRGFWYPALRSEQVYGSRMRTAMLLGIPLVLGRDDRARPFALRDACPHRAMPLSRGWFDGKRVQCSYHGWKFEPTSGQCTEIPSLVPGQDLDVSKIYANAFPCREQDGFFWVYLPEKGEKFRGNQEPEGDPPKLPTFSQKFTLTFLSADLPVNVDHGIIGLMDPAHGPFVHQAWWWRTRRSIHEKAKQFEPIPNGFRMSAHTPSSNSAPYKLLRAYAKAEGITTTIDFVLPNCRYETIHAGKYWFSSLTTVTPITANACRIDVRAAWNIFCLVPGVLPIFRFFGKKFMEQDRQTMEIQAEGLKHDPAMMLIDDADRPAKWYFALKQALLESRASGTAMKHPMSGPVTLKWRS